MLKFKAVELSDGLWIDPLLRESGMLGNDYTFPNIYNWRCTYNTQIARADGWLVVRCGLRDPYYLFPAGSGDIKLVIEEMISDADARGCKFLLRGVEAAPKALLEAEFPGRFSFSEDRGSFDYLYTREKLAGLSGKKLHQKRNFINRFLSECSDWSYEPISARNIGECLEMNDEWCRLNHCPADGIEPEAAAPEKEPDNGLGQEQCAVHSALNHFFELNMIGGALRVNGKIVAFTAGEVYHGNCVMVNIEKAFLEPDGCYAMINNQFARSLPENILYLNREDDVGDEGLRRAKLSYNPDILVEKYDVTLAN